MNAIRERVSIIQRAGGRSSRVGATYINGAAYIPRVLIALMNIWRVHYNFFDWRPYRTPLEARMHHHRKDQRQALRRMLLVRQRMAIS